MSDETKLNPELTELESSLSSLAAPACSLNRDELMYRSGWEAALASSDHSAQLQSTHLRSPGKKVGRQWLLPTISVLSSAAAILFGIMLLSQSPDQPGAELAIAKHSVPAGLEIAESISTEQAEDVNTVVAAGPDLLRLVMDFPAGKTLHAGMVVGSSFPAASEPDLNSPVSPRFENATPPMTQRELLDELLPNRIDRSPKWSLFRMGGRS